MFQHGIKSYGFLLRVVCGKSLKFRWYLLVIWILGAILA
ncbi:hypothetical protein V6Z11_D05G291500 [Gossypium hirsutum]